MFCDMTLPKGTLETGHEVAPLLALLGKGESASGGSLGTRKSVQF
jgi:hypothetical protein